MGDNKRTVVAFEDKAGTLHRHEVDRDLADAIFDVEAEATKVATIMEEHAPYSEDARCRQVAEVSEFKSLLLSILSHRKADLMRLLDATDRLDAARAAKANSK